MTSKKRLKEKKITNILKSLKRLNKEFLIMRLFPVTVNQESYMDGEIANPSLLEVVKMWMVNQDIHQHHTLSL